MPALRTPNLWLFLSFDTVALQFSTPFNHNIPSTSRNKWTRTRWWSIRVLSTTITSPNHENKFVRDSTKSTFAAINFPLLGVAYLQATKAKGGYTSFKVVTPFRINQFFSRHQIASLFIHCKQYCLCIQVKVRRSARLRNEKVIYANLKFCSESQSELWRWPLCEEDLWLLWGRSRWSMH